MLLKLTFMRDGKNLDLKNGPNEYNLIRVRDGEGTAEIPFLGTCVLESEVARRVRHKLRKLGLDSDVILEGNVSHGDVIIAALVNDIHLTRQGIGRHDHRCLENVHDSTRAG